MSIARPATLLLFGAVIVILSSCTPPTQNARQSTSLQEPKEIVLDENDGTSSEQPSRSAEYAGESPQVPRVQIPGEYQVLQIVDTNLDLDRNDEQLLVVKSTEETTAPVEVKIADYDSVRDKYVVTWESSTRANYRKDFNLSVLDVTGDHNLEIICSGLTAEGEQTLDIYRRSTSPETFGLYFESILSLKVQGTIELQEKRRSESYQKGLKSGQSFPVVTTTKDENSENLVDLTKQTYIWRNNTEQYALVQTEDISGQEIEDQQLRELFTSGTSRFEEFLSGPWILTNQKDLGGGRYLINFNPQEETITFYTGDIQEIYHWKSSYRFLSNGLSIHGENEIVPYITMQITAYVQDMKNIRLLISDINSHNATRNTNTTWSGVYQKLGPSTRRSLLARSSDPEGDEHLPSLTGLYKSDTHPDIYFDPPYFRYREGEDNSRGGFSVYSMGADILELRFLNENGITEGHRRYSFDYVEQKKSNEIVRRLILTPGKLGVNGFRPTSNEPIRYEQVEILDEEEQEGSSEGSENASANPNGGEE
jgi:hypothetical protein